MPLAVQTEQSQQDQVQTNQPDAEEIEEIQGGRVRTIYDKVYDMTERFACTHMGQFVIERADRMLRVIEDTAKWSLPQEKTELQLKRPLPWLPFLWMIVWLRVIRIWVSVAALLIGNGPVSPQDVVYFIQSRRQKLRAIRVYGVRIIIERKTEANANEKHSGESTNPLGIMGNLRKILTSAICRPGLHYEPIRRIYVRHDFEQGADDGATDDPLVSMGKRPRDDEGIDEDEDAGLTTDQMLAEYANQNSDDDSDYVPNFNEDTNDEESNTSTASDSNPEEGAVHNSMNEQEVLSEPEPKNDESNKETAESNKNNLDVSVEVREGGGEHVRPMLSTDADIKREPLSDVDSSSEHPQPPKENGQGENREDVVQKSATAIHKLNAPHEYKPQCKSTPGHETAALIRPRVLPTIGTTATAVPISSADTPPFYEHPDHKHPAYSPTCTNSSSASYSETSSDLDSFVTNEDFDFNEYQLSEPDIETENRRTEKTAQKHYSNLSESSDSSSEDEFYSPVGSPIDFNSIMKPVSILKKPMALSANADAQFTPHSTGDPDNSENSPPAKKQVQHQLPHRHTQQHNQQRFQHRYRGRNRR